MLTTDEYRARYARSNQSDLLSLLELIAALASSDGRRLADRAAGTQVIRRHVYEASFH